MTSTTNVNEELPGPRDPFRRRGSLFIGTQYFRPPNPRAEDFDRDLALMRATGLEMAKAWVYWCKVNPRPGVWDFSAYDALFDAAGRQGIRILVQLMTESAPYWLEAQHPDFRYVDAHGRSIPLHAVSSVQVGGYPGFCFHHAGARMAVETYLRQAVEHCRSRPEVESYDVWNEIWLPECHCPATQARFRQYLEQKYGSIQALNHAYGGASYTNFAQTCIPPETPALWIALKPKFDYFDFLREVKNERMRWLVDTVLAADASRPIVGHTAVGHLLGTTGLDCDQDPWELAVPVDKWGVSSYIGEHTVDQQHPLVARLSRRELQRIALQFNVTRDSAAGKPWWLAEHTAGEVWYGLASARRSPSETVLKTLLAFSFGAEASVYWQWRPEIFGVEAPQFGLTALDGAPTPQSEAVAQVCRVLEEHKSTFDSLSWPAPRIGLLWEPQSAYWARCTADPLTARHFEGLYGALIDSGYSVAILNAPQLAAAGVPAGIEVLFAPVQHFDRTGLAEHLTQWVHEGGTLIAGPLFQLFDADHFAQQRFPPPPMDEVFGAQHRRREYLEEADAVGLPSERWVETYVLHGAKALARWQQHAVLTHHPYGTGHAVLCGSFVGAGYREGDSQPVRDFIHRMCRLGGVAREVSVTGECLARVARSGRSMVAFIFNCSDQVSQCEVTIPDAGLLARDLMSGDSLRRSSGEPFRIRLEPKASSILLIEIAGPEA